MRNAYKVEPHGTIQHREIFDNDICALEDGEKNRPSKGRICIANDCSISY